ncbi:hypothetical protein AJ80_06741 [Polytolypa hystricis UAMH7299]|uniref:Uncharacterized protein n=1 Tax=Polytolypa hystricis (strain UAMH7299) TaxID=1447883 RepID=A0A2B7XU90_POLH7|nr:hypothetical protein AJ80_06741 [Polytolypa hystricis UAMH7299]
MDELQGLTLFPSPQQQNGHGAVDSFSSEAAGHERPSTSQGAGQQNINLAGTGSRLSSPNQQYPSEFDFQLPVIDFEIPREIDVPADLQNFHVSEAFHHLPVDPAERQEGSTAKRPRDEHSTESPPLHGENDSGSTKKRCIGPGPDLDQNTSSNLNAAENENPASIFEFSSISDLFDGIPESDIQALASFVAVQDRENASGDPRMGDLQAGSIADNNVDTTAPAIPVDRNLITPSSEESEQNPALSNSVQPGSSQTAVYPTPVTVGPSSPQRYSQSGDTYVPPRENTPDSLFDEPISPDETTGDGSNTPTASVSELSTGVAPEEQPNSPKPSTVEMIKTNFSLQNSDIQTSQLQDVFRHTHQPPQYISPYAQVGGPLGYFPSTPSIYVRCIDILDKETAKRLERNRERIQKLTYERNRYMKASVEWTSVDPVTRKTKEQIMKEEPARLNRLLRNQDKKMAELRQEMEEWRAKCGHVSTLYNRLLQDTSMIRHPPASHQLAIQAQMPGPRNLQHQPGPFGPAPAPVQTTGPPSQPAAYPIPGSVYFPTHRPGPSGSAPVPVRTTGPSSQPAAQAGYPMSASVHFTPHRPGPFGSAPAPLPIPPHQLGTFGPAPVQTTGPLSQPATQVVYPIRPIPSYFAPHPPGAFGPAPTSTQTTGTLSQPATIDLTADGPHPNPGLASMQQPSTNHGTDLRATMQKKNYSWLGDKNHMKGQLAGRLAPTQHVNYNLNNSTVLINSTQSSDQNGDGGRNSACVSGASENENNSRSREAEMEGEEEEDPLARELEEELERFCS